MKIAKAMAILVRDLDEANREIKSLHGQLSAKAFMLSDKDKEIEALKVSTEAYKISDKRLREELDKLRMMLA